MNKKQKNILITVIVTIITMLIFPPFQVINRWGVAYNMGYGWLFSPPMSMGMVTANVNITMLIIQWLGVLIVGGIAYFLSKNLISSESPILEPKASYSRNIIKLEAPITINHEDYSIFMAFIKHPIVFIFGGILLSLLTLVFFILFSALLDFIDYFQILRPFWKMMLLPIILVPIFMFPVMGQSYVNFYVRNGLGIVWLYKFIQNLPVIISRRVP